MTALEAALLYAQQGRSVIPVAVDKKPLIPWEPYQHQRATPETIRGWYKKYPDAGVAIITGSISGVFVVDVDPRHGGDLSPYGLLPATLTVRTGGGGWHFYFKGTQPSRTGIVPGVDIKGDGGYVVAPPSGHLTGGTYTQEAGDGPIDPPAWLLELIQKARQVEKEEHPTWVTEALKGAAEGERHKLCVRLAGYFRSRHPQDITLALLKDWAQKCQPPFPMEQVEANVKSVYQYPRVAPDQGPQAQNRLIGTRQEFYWPRYHLYAMVRSIREHRDGRTTAEVSFKSDAEGLPPHILETQVNLLASTTKKLLARDLQERYPLETSAWQTIIEDLCRDAVAAHRKGHPVEHIWTLPEGEELPSRTFLLRPLLYESKPTLFFGEGGTAKSSMAILCSILTTLPEIDTLGMSSKRANALYLDYEGEREEFQHRLSELQKGLGLPAFSIPYRQCSLPFVDDIERIEEAVAESHATFLVVDSLGVAAGGNDLTEAATATSFFASLRRLPVTTLLIAHTAKSQERGASPYGSVFYYNLSRSIFEVRRQAEPEPNQLNIALFHRKNNQGPLFPPLGFCFQFGQRGTRVTRLQPETVPDFLEKMGLRARIKALLGQGKLPASAIAEELQAPVETVRTTLSQMKARGQVLNTEHDWGLPAPPR